MIRSSAARGIALLVGALQLTWPAALGRSREHGDHDGALLQIHAARSYVAAALRPGRPSALTGLGTPFPPSQSLLLDHPAALTADLPGNEARLATSTLLALPNSRAPPSLA